MRAITIFCIIAAVMILLVTFGPQSNDASRRKLRKIKKAILMALLLKGKKKYIFPLPLPLPLPIPVIKKTVPEPWPEPVWPAPEPWPESWSSWGGGGW
ncbi:uncharacterized protein LOC141853227 [Brevipalpus obovatus]|uniref:uncharacterized protein LOC141853227 n=1 Tax=Brevipalpus obovatus TaxID=246614 RepID=UPI003D9E86BE